MDYKSRRPDPLDDGLSSGNSNKTYNKQNDSQKNNKITYEQQENSITFCVERNNTEYQQQQQQENQQQNYSPLNNSNGLSEQNFNHYNNNNNNNDYYDDNESLDINNDQSNDDSGVLDDERENSELSIDSKDSSQDDFTPEQALKIYEELKEKIHYTNEKNEELQCEVESYKNMNATLSGKLQKMDQLDSERKRLQNQLLQEQQRLAEYKSYYDDYEKKCEEVGRLRIQYTSVEQERDSIYSNLEEIEKEKEDLENDNKKLKEKIEKIEEMKNHWADTAKQLQELIEEHQKRFDEYNQRNNELQQNKQTIQKLNQENTKIKQDLEDKQINLSALQTENQNLKNQMEVLENQLNSTKEQFANERYKQQEEQQILETNSRPNTHRSLFSELNELPSPLQNDDNSTENDDEYFVEIKDDEDNINSSETNDWLWKKLEQIQNAFWDQLKPLEQQLQQIQTEYSEFIDKLKTTSSSSNDNISNKTNEELVSHTLCGEEDYDTNLKTNYENKKINSNSFDAVFSLSLGQYFELIAVSTKILLQRQLPFEESVTVASIDIRTLYSMLLRRHIPVHQWIIWIPRQIEAYLHQIHSSVSSHHDSDAARSENTKDPANPQNETIVKNNNNSSILDSPMFKQKFSKSLSPTFNTLPTEEADMT